MKFFVRRLLLSAGFWLILGARGSFALPGQTVNEVEAWIQAHPTLRPAPGESLLVRFSDTPAQRFIFQASILAPGQLGPTGNGGTIRSERMQLFDMINGITFNRLEESLRSIYGADVYSDFRRSVTVYAYPNEASPPPRNPDLLLQGELREGVRYGYWVELAANQAGVIYTGRINVLLKEDLRPLQNHLQRSGKR
ncbi:MAG: hypothetical protein QNJ46_04760 [Leptolyngbyaceae cyanobacterium MO_188.B28]|nr:hypothetical protein [Leptolyngbyaceae cyanobacterium MO_188.B28]